LHELTYAEGLPREACAGIRHREKSKRIGLRDRKKPLY
jgi:hypothetical protein